MSGLRLNRRLVLEERVEVADGAGGVHKSWTALGSVWADVENFSGSETGKLGVARSTLRLRITVRAAPIGSQQRPRPDQRFREGSRIYRITAVAEQEPNGRYLTCFANEEVAA